MSEVKARYPIGKTQWSKWNDPAREAFNSMRDKGFEFMVAVEEANAVQASQKKKKSVLDILHDVEDIAGDVAGVVAAVSPLVAVASTVVKAAKGKKGK